jgi:hypothetical protein
MTQLVQREYPKSALEKSIHDAADAQTLTRPYEVLPSEAPALPSKEEDIGHQCDLCGVLMPASRLQTTDGNVQLCDHCYGQYVCIPQGKIRQCLQRYLMGNVV